MAQLKDLIVNGSANILGTIFGNLSGNASTATKLETARTIRTNLASTSTASFNGSANVTPGVTGTLPIANGGTGATSAAGALSNFGLTATAAELNYCDGVTSNIQTQLNGRQATITGGASTIASSDLTANRALVANSSGKVAVSAVTDTELGYLDGATSNIQTQLNAKLSLSGGTMTGDLTAKNAGGSWINQRINRGINFTDPGTDTSSWWPWLGANTPNGDWAIGTLGDKFYIKYATDINYSAGTNTTSGITISTNGTITGNLSGNATTATTATKLGSSTVGGTAKPIYLSSGTATACSDTIGGTAKPVYMNAGTITACSSTVGSATKPVYMNGGTITACTYTLEKSVPSNAVFTDTTYSAATTSIAGLMSASDKTNLTYFVAGTQTKSTNVWTGTLSSVSTPYDGLTIRYYLPYAGTSNGATLTLNNGTAYPVYRYGRTTQITTHFSAGSIITMTFRTSYSVSGTNYTNAWIVDAYYDSNNYTGAICWTGASTAAKIANVNYYTLANNKYIIVMLSNSNSYAGALTLNINSSGAKPIYINGTVSSSSNYTLPKGVYLVYYDGTNYYFRTDGYITGNLVGSLNGNASTATKFASSQSVALTGDVTGSVSSQAGWSVATTLAASGVTAGSYGPSANASPAHSGTFSVPYITVDAKGRVTGASTKTITLPSDNNTDTKVTQAAAITTNGAYPVLLGYSTATTSLTNTVNKTSTLTYNPSTGVLTATTFSGNATSATKATQDGNGVNIASNYMKFVSSTSAPSDTSGRTVWYDSTNKILKFYVNGAWQGMNTYQ